MIDTAAGRRVQAKGGNFKAEKQPPSLALGSISPCDLPSAVVAICSGWLGRFVLQATYQSVGNRLCVVYT